LSGRANELRAVHALAEEAHASGTGAVLAHLVSVEGSHYRRPGARMLATADGRTAGGVSGGCLERDLFERVPAVLVRREVVAVDYDLRAPADRPWGLGLGCDGAVRILLEPLDAEALAFLRSVARAHRGRRSLSMATVAIAGPEAPLGARFVLETHASAALSGAARDAVEEALREPPRRSRTLPLPGGGVALLEHLAPPVRLLAFGNGPDIPPLLRLAEDLGWDAGLRRDIQDVGQPDARTAAVVMTHSFARDLEILRALAEDPPPYVGLLGPRTRAERLLSALGPSAAPLEPVLHAPVGLALGAETPAEIALAIVAEVQAAFSPSHRA
jgi:xanthine/CO dehydrogenase XdhC/CoxF family maturation factor